MSSNNSFSVKVLLQQIRGGGAGGGRLALTMLTQRRGLQGKSADVILEIFLNTEHEFEQQH